MASWAFVSVPQAFQMGMPTLTDMKKKLERNSTPSRGRRLQTDRKVYGHGKDTDIDSLNRLRYGYER